MKIVHNAVPIKKKNIKNIALFVIALCTSFANFRALCCIGSSVQIKFLTRGNFKVYDVCESANLICDDAQIIQKIMKWSLGNWKMLKEETIKRGELLFLNSGKNEMINNEISPAAKWFYEQCLVIPETEVRQFRCICRAFKKQDTNNSSTKSLYCIDVYSEKND